MTRGVSSLLPCLMELQKKKKENIEKKIVCKNFYTKLSQGRRDQRKDKKKIHTGIRRVTINPGEFNLKERRKRRIRNKVPS